MTTSEIKIDGMSCGHCVNWISQALMKVDGVAEAKVDLERQRAMVRYDEARVTERMMAMAIENAGYTALEFVRR